MSIPFTFGSKLSATSSSSSSATTSATSSATTSATSSTSSTVQPTYPLQSRTYTFDIQEWNHIRGYVNHIINRIDEIMPKVLSDKNTNSWLESLKQVMQRQQNILDILKTIELAPVNVDVVEFLKQLETRKTITNTEHYIRVDKYLKRLKKIKVSLADKLLTSAEYKTLLEFLANDAIIVREMHHEIFELFRKYFNENLIKFHTVSETLKTIAIQWKKTMYAQEVERVGKEIENFCKTELLKKNPTEIESKFEGFDGELIMLTDDIDTIQLYLDNMISNIKAQVSEATGLLKHMVHRRSSITKLKDNLMLFFSL